MNSIQYYKDKIYKNAALNSDVKLYPHQQRVLDDPSTSKILAHPTGSGKTLTAIAKFEKMKQEGKAKKNLVIVPAGLRDNFAESGIKKFTDSTYNIVGTKQENAKGGKYGDIDPSKDYNIISYEIFKKDPERYIRESGADTVTLDENQRTKNEGTQITESFKRVRHLYKNHIGLTGSPISNTMADIHPLVDVASGKQHSLGKNKDAFEKMFMRKSKDPKYKGVHEKRVPVVGLKNEDVLKKDLNKYVDYMDIEDIRDIARIPKQEINLRKITISKEQAKLYKQLLNDNPRIKDMIKTKRLETLKDDELSQAFSKMVEARKLMNDYASVVPGRNTMDSIEKSPKLKAVLDDTENYLKMNPKGRALLFSHLIHGGIDSLEAGLKAKHIPYGKFIGKGNKDVTEETRQTDVNDYNAGKKRVMLISSAGGEGLSLNDTNFEGVLDPHYNPEKMKQMEARGIRSGGLSSLPKEKRVVKTNRYMSTMPKNFWIFPSSIRTPDEFIYEVAKNKNRQNKILYDFMKKNRRSQNEHK